MKPRIVEAMRRVVHRSIIPGLILVGVLPLGGACWQLDAEECGTYTEIGQITCYTDDPNPEVCAVHPKQIIWPTSYNVCATAVSVGKTQCDPNHEQVHPLIITYCCNGCEILEAHVDESQEYCWTAQLSGTTCIGSE
jgi:hypothetical protein